MKLSASTLVSVLLVVCTGCGTGSVPPDITGNWHITSTSSINGAVIHSDGPILDVPAK